LVQKENLNENISLLNHSYFHEGFGIPPNHLLIASLISAPAALGIAKVVYPETDQTEAHWDASKNLPNAYDSFEVV
jgi:nucleoside permease NupC